MPEPMMPEPVEVIPRLLSFFLPQFHPVAENDEWWGKGFTEWNNVVKARPRFRGHYQPHLPADLGFYDLRVEEVREQQAALARSHGIDAFCYYHYWFDGRRILERPVDDLMSRQAPDFPFLLCWANENWTRAWDGLDREILLGQRYSAADDRQHIEHLLPYFSDDRYVKLEGKPVFLVYRASDLPEPVRTTDLWRQAALDHGLPGLQLCRVDRFPEDAVHDPASQGFDAAVEFQPEGVGFPPPMLRSRILRELNKRGPAALPAPTVAFDYGKVAETMRGRPAPAWPRYGCVTPGWDNTARRRRGAMVLHDSTPAAYEAWLEHALLAAKRQPLQSPFVFVNAWNEWSEGAHLEPDARWGRAYLEATLRAVERVREL